jgi:hypothetical protein
VARFDYFLAGDAFFIDIRRDVFWKSDFPYSITHYHFRSCAMRIAALLLMCAFIFPVAVFAAEKLPSGFIALSESPMTWANAKNFCEQKGGSLPLVGGSGDNSRKKGTPIDGFGAVGAPWPADLAKGDYWTGTGSTSGARFSWVVRNSCTGVEVLSSNQGGTGRVVCVSK